VNGVDFHRENLLWGGKFLGGEFSRENFTLMKFDRLPIRIVFDCLTFPLPTQLGRCSKEIMRGLFSACFEFLRKNFHGTGIFGVIEKPIKN
jgi:hypothetical protein